MNVRELIAELQQLDPELPVLLQEDAEGNGYARLRCIDDNCAYAEREGEYGLEVKLYQMTPELEKKGFRTEDVQTCGVRCVVFSP